VARNERLHLIEREGAWSPSESTLSPDGRRIAVEYRLTTTSPSEPELPGGRRTAVHKVIVWDIDGRKPAFELTAGNPSLPPGAFSHDNRTLAITRGRSVVLLDAETSKPRRTYGPLDADVTAVAYSPDGHLLAVGDASAGITLFDIATGDDIEHLLGHEQPISLLAFRGNDTLVSLCKQGKVKEWNLGRSRRVVFPDLGPGYGGLSIDPTRRYALTTRPAGPPPDRSTVREADLWDISSGDPRQVFRKPLSLPGSPHAVAMVNSHFSPSGRRVLVTYQEDQRRRVNPIFPRPESVGHLLPTPVDWFGGITRASLGWTSQLPALSRTVVWDVPSGETLLDLPHLTSTPQFSRDGRYLTLHQRIDNRIGWAEGDRRVWDLSVRPARLVSLETPTIPLGPDEHINWDYQLGPGERFISCTARTFQAATRRGPQITTGVFLIRWDLETGRLVFNRPLPDAPKGPSHDQRLVFSPDMTRIVAVPNSEDGAPVIGGSTELRMWELRPDGEAVRIWTDSGDWITGQDEGTKSTLTQLLVECLPDGKKMLIVGEKQARLFNLDAMDRPIILRGVRGFPYRAALSDDSRRLIMLSNNAPIGLPKQMELKVWDLVTRQELLALPVNFPERFGGPSFVRTFDGKQLKLFLRSDRGGEFYTLDGSPRMSKP
jgi:WD40 repeat protein